MVFGDRRGAGTFKGIKLSWINPGFKEFVAVRFSSVFISRKGIKGYDDFISKSALHSELGCHLEGVGLTISHRNVFKRVNLT